MWLIIVFVVVIIMSVVLVWRYSPPRVVELPQYSNIADSIMKHAKVSVPPFSVRESTRETHVVLASHNTKAIVYLRTVNKVGTKYDDQTIMNSLLHQLTHISVRNGNHSQAFYTMLDRLTVSAKQLHVYDPWSAHNPEYPSASE